ncbi:MAG: hypothetical protein AMJ69_07375 [Gammaproteobacteria bacterium SG8_47]|nr:MAG: hypothetical protein AMJ69_07375 [Gammaproteobacteria bacterium SG8_47]
MPKFLCHWLYALAAALLCALLSSGRLVAAEHEVFQFALMGDAPYGSLAVMSVNALIDDINAQPELLWVVHAGDIKQGSSPCSDELLKSRLDLFQQFHRPFVLTPGDNEWTDCHRQSAGGYAPLERLEFLRQLFFPRVGYTLGREPMAVESQARSQAFSEFRENVRWVHHNVVFATLHVVGSRNGGESFMGRTTADNKAAARRSEAALVWLRETFALARERDYAGVFLVMQADPFFELSPGGYQRRPFEPVLQALEEETLRFGKAVLFAHGDSHKYRYDQPLRDRTTGKTIPNFWRVETQGGFVTAWLRVRVDPNSTQVFHVEQGARAGQDTPTRGGSN